MSQLFASVGQSIGVTASTSVLPMLGEIKWINTCKACWTRLTYVVVQSLGLVQLFATPWTAAHLASLSFTLSQSLLRLMSIQLVCDAIQPSHPLSPPSPHTLSLSQHQGLFQQVSSLQQVAKVLELQLQHQSFQWILRVDFLQDWLVWSPCCPRDSLESSPAQFESINSPALSLLYSPTITSIHDNGKNRSFGSIDFCQQSDVSAF